MADKFREAARADARRAFREAFELGPAAMTGKPMLPAEYLKAAGVPDKFWPDVRDDFEAVSSTSAAEALGTRWADRVVEHIEGFGAAPAPDSPLVRAMLGER
jgi:hypothetical protein